MSESKMIDKEKIAKSSLKMSLVTTVSRIFGLLRDQIQAALLGTTFIADAFAIGFMLPNLLRRLFAEGNMVASFIPVFTELEKEKGSEESKKFFRAVFTLLGLILIGIVLIGIIISPLLVKILYKSADNNMQALNLASDLSRIMFPYLFFISLAALMQGVLNIRGYYSISAASPILLNAVIILSALFFKFFLPNFFSNMSYVFAFAVLVGGFVQFSYQMPFVYKQGFSFKPYFNFKEPLSLYTCVKGFIITGTIDEMIKIPAYLFLFREKLVLLNTKEKTIKWQNPINAWLVNSTVFPEPAKVIDVLGTDYSFPFQAENPANKENLWKYWNDMMGDKPQDFGIYQPVRLDMNDTSDLDWVEINE